MDRKRAIKIIKDCKEKSYKRIYYTVNEYEEAFDMAIKALEQKPCTDAISRKQVLELAKDICVPTGNSMVYYRHRCIDPQDIRDLPSVSVAEKTDAYKQGWHDAISTALKETHSVQTEDGYFRVVQEETLIGVGMSIPPVSAAEKVGEWKTTKPFWGYECSVCGRIVENPVGDVYDKYPYCHCGARMVEPQ